MNKILKAEDTLAEVRNCKIGDAEDIFVEARSYIECVRLAACQLPTCEESEAIAAVAMDRAVAAAGTRRAERAPARTKRSGK